MNLQWMNNHLSPRVVRFVAVITLGFFVSSSIPQAGHSLTVPTNAQGIIALDPNKLASALAGNGKIRQDNPPVINLPGESNAPSSVIIHIQDAHANYSAQKNIARIIEKTVREYRRAAHIAGRDPATLRIGIAVEGLEGEPDFSAMDALPQDENRRHTADYFMKQALITGAEFEIFASGSKHQYFGVDTDEFLNRDVGLYLAVMAASRKNAPFLKRISEEIAQAEHRLGNKDLRLLYARQREAQEDHGKYLEYLQFLLEITGERGRDGSMEKIVKFQREIDPVKLESEIRKAGKDWRRLSPLRLLIYPQLRRQLKYESEMAAIDMDQWLKEIPDLEHKAKRKLIKNDKERTFDTLSEGFSMVEKISRLELSPAEWNQWRLIRSRTMASFKRWNKGADDWRVFLRVIELAEAFYLIASHRDNRMAENLLNEVEKRHLDLCFLIAGGFHSEGLAKNLSLAEQPYIVIAPAIESLPVDEKELYRRRLSGHSRIAANSVWKRYFAAGDGVIPAFIQTVKAVQKEGAAAVFTPSMIQESVASVPPDRFFDEEMSFSELTAGIPAFGRSEVRAIPQIELRSDDPTVIDFINTAYDQFQRFVADPQWRADKKLILVLGHTRPDTDAVFSSISRAYLKSLELRHANHETTIVVPMINTLNANEKTELEKFRGDVLYYLTDVMRFDLDRVLFFHEAADALRQLESSKLEIYLTDHNQLVKEQRHWALLVREILDHHDVNKLAQIREQYPSAQIDVEEIGSSSTLAAGIISNPAEMREDLAKLLLAGLISDTSNLTDPDPAKVTDKDRKVAETLRQRAGGHEAADLIYEQMNDRYDTITGLTDAEALQKDFKDYRVTVGGQQNSYSISSLRIGRAKEEEFGQREFAIANALKQMSADQGYSVSLLNIGYRDAYPAGDTSAAKNQARLYIVSRDANAARDLADLLAGTVQGLVAAKRQDLPENVIQLSYKDETLSRKKLTPVINVFSAVSKEDYYASRVKSIYAGVEVKSRPVIPYNEWVDLVLRHEKGKEGIFRNYEVLKERGQIDYAQKEPVDYREVQEDVQESEEGKKAIENGEVMIMRPFGGTGGRAFGYKIPARYRIRGLYIPMLKFMLGENLRYISAWEMVFAHARYLLRHYRTTHLGIMSATNKDQHHIFETDLKEKKYYGLNPENVLIYPVAGIPSLNPSLGDLSALTDDDKDKFRKSVAAYLNYIKEPKNKTLLDEIVKELNFEALAGEFPKNKGELDEKIIFPFITKVNGGEQGFFTYADGSLRYKNPSHMTVLSNAFADGTLYDAWKQGFRILVYGNDTDLGHVVDESLLSYLKKRKEEAGVQMLALLVSKDIKFTFNNDEGKEQAVTARKQKVSDPTQPEGYRFDYKIVESGSKLNLTYQPFQGGGELQADTYGFEFKFDNGKDTLRVFRRSEDGSVQIIAQGKDIKVKPEKGGVPINLDGQDVLGEAWALPDTINQNEIPTYNPASYLFFIEDAFKAFGVKNPDDFPEIAKNPDEIDRLLHEFNSKINTYWEVKEEADTNDVHWVFLKDGRKAEVVSDEEGGIIRSNLKEMGVEIADPLQPVFDEKVVGTDDKGKEIKKEVIVALKDKSGQIVFSEESIKLYAPPRFALQPAQLLGDITFILKTEFVNIDRDGTETPIGYGVAKEKEDPLKYQDLMIKVQSNKMDLVNDPSEGTQAGVTEVAAITKENVPSAKEIIQYIEKNVEASMPKKPRSEVRKIPAGIVNEDEIAGAMRQVFSEMGLSQEPIALVYDHRLPTRAEMESLRSLRHVSISLRWDLTKFPDVISRQNELQKGGLGNLTNDPSFRGRFFANLTQGEAPGSMLQSQTWRAGNRRTVILTNRREDIRDPYLILTAEKIKQPVAAALLLALVDGNIEDLPPELRIFVLQGGNRYGFRDDINVNAILNQLLIEQKTVKRSA